MKNLLPFLLMLLLSVPGASQHYQAISSNRISYFENESGNIYCIRIDSATFETDSVFFPLAQIQQMGSNCYTPYGASWLGQKVLIRDNGDNIFFTATNDSVVIKTAASINDTWTAFRLTDSLFITATVIEQDTLHLLGLVDSVKTIGFSVYDKDMHPLNSSLSHMKLRISKHYGMITTFPFYLFPGLQQDFQDASFEVYELVGMSDPEVGLQNLTWAAVNDFQPNDELHITHESVYNDLSQNISITDKAIYSYLERHDYPDSIVYYCARKQHILTTTTSGSATVFYNDTVKTVIRPDSIFDGKLPGEPVISGVEAYAYQMTNGAIIAKIKPSVHEIIVPSADSCWIKPIADGCFPSYTYIRGLGGPYYECTHAFAFGGEARKLVYYKKGTTTWGSPLTITSSDEYREKTTISVFPNPASDFIIIGLPDLNPPVFFELTDISGRTILTKSIDSPGQRINIMDLNAGIYLYKLRTGNTLLETGRVIIR